LAFDLANFAYGNVGANAPALHMYKSTDTVATVNTAGYFNSIAARVRVGDFVLAYLDTGGTPQGYLLAINANSGTVVDVTDGLAVGTTDTD
jgi:hypothetical protein